MKIISNFKDYYDYAWYGNDVEYKRFTNLEEKISDGNYKVPKEVKNKIIDLQNKLKDYVFPDEKILIAGERIFHL